MKVTCLDFSLASNMNIMIERLCLNSPKADIEILETTVQWQYSSTFKVTDVDIRQAQIIGTEHLFSNQNNANQNDKTNKNSQISSTLQSYINQISQLKLPVNLNVTQLEYLPFNAISSSSTSNQEHQVSSYTANLSAIGDMIYFSLRNADNIEFINAKLDNSNIDSKKIKYEEGFAIDLSGKLNLLKKFLNTHQLPLAPTLQNTLSNSEISGDINTVITYQNNKLSVHNRIAKLAIISKSGINNSGPFKLTSTLNFRSQLQLSANEKLSSPNIEITLSFIEANTLALDYSQTHLISMLEDHEISPTLIAILKDNPLGNLKLTLADSTAVSLDNKQVSLSGVKVKASGDERAHLVELNKVTFSLPSSDLAIESFIVDSEIRLADIASFTTAPVSVHLEGGLQKSEQKIALNLTKNSIITAKNITLATKNAKQKNKSKAKSKTKPKAKQEVNNKKEYVQASLSAIEKSNMLISLKTLSSTLEGNLQLLENNILSMNVKARSQASQIKVPKTLQIKSFELVSEIKGNLDDIKIDATANADGVNLGTIVISGPVLAPKVQVAAKGLQLTNLLSLNIQLPTKIELVDGLLDYSVSGQITNFNDIKNTPLSTSVAVTSLSGDIDGIWLQELNWQQHFTLLAGKITTTPNTEENLTVELIETATPISKLSINTSWTFNKSFAFSASKLKADVLGGSFSITKLQWPFEHGHSVNVQLESIDLEQVLALDKKQGIVVTGDISGQLPVTFDGEKYIIVDGELHNISNGLIQVINNPAVAELKASNSQLQLAFDALQNLHYHQLSSEVSMADDGYMLLETVIKGRNPDIDNDVNLNLNLSYDLLGLLESLSITQRFEESIIKGLQKNKE